MSRFIRNARRTASEEAKSSADATPTGDKEKPARRNRRNNRRGGDKSSNSTSQPFFYSHDEEKKSDAALPRDDKETLEDSTTAETSQTSKSHRRRRRRRRRNSRTKTGKVTADTADKAAITPEEKKVEEDEMECGICCTPTVASNIVFECPEKDGHKMCKECFPTFMVGVSERYYEPNVFPIKCPFGECSFIPSEGELKNMVSTCAPDSKTFEERWTKYETSMLQAAYISTEHEVPVTCTKCNKYTELFPEDYKSDAAKLNGAFQLWRDKVHTQALLSQVSGKQEIEEMKELGYSVEIVDAATPAVESVSHWSKLTKKLTTVLSSSPVVKPQVSKPKKVSKDKVKRLHTKLKFEEQYSKLSWLEKMAEKHQVGKFDPSQSSLTSSFFTCKNEECDVSICLACTTMTKKTDRLYHSCTGPMQNKTYRKLCRVMKKAATRTCPFCDTIGIKDENCCHMTCTKDTSKYWCYHCAQPFDNKPHVYMNFANGNRNGCPSYLQNKYGETAENGKPFSFETSKNGQRWGNGGRSVELFHTHLKMQAFQEFEAKYEDQDELQFVLREYFPDGLWDKKDELRLLEIEKENEKWFVDFELDKKQKEAAAAKAAAEAAQAAAEAAAAEAAMTPEERAARDAEVAALAAAQEAERAALAAAQEAERIARAEAQAALEAQRAAEREAQRQLAIARSQAAREAAEAARQAEAQMTLQEIAQREYERELEEEEANDLMFGLFD